MSTLLGVTSCQKDAEQTPTPQPNQTSAKIGQFIYKGVSYFEPLDGDNVYINPILNTLLTGGKDHQPVVHSLITKENGKIQYFLYDTEEELKKANALTDTPPAGRTQASYYASLKVYKGENFNGSYSKYTVDSKTEIRAHDLSPRLSKNVRSIEIFNDGSEHIYVKFFTEKQFQGLSYWVRAGFQADFGLTSDDLSSTIKAAESFKFGYPVVGN